MERKKALIIFLAVVFAVSVLWPLSYMLKSKAHQTGNQTQQEPKTIRVGSVEEFRGQTYANVTEIEPTIIGTGYSNNGTSSDLESIISSWEGVKSVSVKRTESDDNDYLYRFDIQVNLTNWTYSEMIGFYMRRLLGLDMKVMLMPAKADLPETLQMKDYESGIEKELSLDKTLVYVQPHTKLGKNPFVVYQQYSAGELRKSVAIGGPAFYIPPIEHTYMPAKAKVLNVTGGLVIASVKWGIKPNTTELEKFADVKFYPASNTTTCPGNISLDIPNATLNYNEEKNETVIHFSNLSDALAMPGCKLSEGKMEARANLTDLDQAKSVLSSMEGVNITDTYYLATVQIPSTLEINGKERRVPKNILNDFKFDKIPNPGEEVDVTLDVSTSFGLIMYVSQVS